ncbi:MAG: hypothetical protein ACP5VS_03235 [Desulfomonilaceae bacterium]
MYSLVDQIFGFVRGPGQKMDFGDVERNLLAILTKVGRQALELYVNEKWYAHRGLEIINAQGNALCV